MSVDLDRDIAAIDSAIAILRAKRAELAGAMANAEKPVSTKEAAHRLGIGERQVRNLISANPGCAEMVDGRSWRVFLSKVPKRD